MGTLDLRASSKRIFHWQYTNWVIALSGGGALTAAVADKFSLAYVLACSAAVYSVGCWLTSDTLASKKTVNISRILLTDGSRAKINSCHFRRWQVIGTLVLLSVFGVSCFGIRHLQIQKELESLKGWLYSADEDINTPCTRATPSDLVVMVGDNAYLAHSLPITALEIDCDPVLRIDRDTDGRIGITLTVRDKDGKVIVDLEQGRFEVNRNNYFLIDRHGSRSTLSVVDQYKHEVLYMHLCNKNTLQLRTSLYYRGVLVSLDEQHPYAAGGITARHSCFGGFRGSTLVHLGKQCLIR